MAGFLRFLYLLSAVAVGVGVSLFAQTPPSQGKEVAPPVAAVDEPASVHAKRVPAPSLLAPDSPFAVEGTKNRLEHSVRMLSEDEMSRADRDLVADGESSIREKAGFDSLEFDGPGWTYHQLDCPALPKHLFLRFTRDDGTRQMSMFSVAIPRDGNGRVLIIPIVRKGYSLFSPAPIGAMTITAFNRIRAEEGEGASADWVGTGLCYAALAGANPQVQPLGGLEENDAPSAVIPPTLRVTDQGGATIQFADMSAAPRPMEWNMIFDHRGKLIKATHSPAQVTRVEKRVGVGEK